MSTALPYINSFASVSVTPTQAIPLLGLVTSVLAWLLLKWHRYENHASKGLKRASQKPAETKPFVTPLPAALSDFDPRSKDPKLYRPFRHGKNFVTMGIRKLDWNNWIEMDSYFLRYHDMKASELKKDINAHVKYVDNAVTRDACFEVYEELVRYLTHRYPGVFQLKDNTLHNTLTEEKFQYPASTFYLSAEGA